MIVSRRHIAAGFAAAVVCASGASWAGGSQPSPPPGGGSGPCCERGGAPTIQTPDVRVSTPGVHVVGPTITGGGHSYTGSVHHTYIGGGSSHRVHKGGGSVIVAGGAGAACCTGGPAPSGVAALNVVGDVIDTITEEVPVTRDTFETRTTTVHELAAIRAVCLDDAGAPHPASRPSPDEEVAPAFDGEIFRCMAGTSMQVTLGRYDHGEPEYDGASTLSCAKGEALRYADGSVRCAREEPRRNCNERSLLRKYGPGVKVARLTREVTEQVAVPVTTVETRTRTVKRPVEHAAPIVFDGGVGAGACLGC